MSSPPAIPRMLERIIDHLDFDHQDGEEYRCGCPVCGSHDNLSVRWNSVTKREVIQCWSGCHNDWGTLSAALRKRGCELNGDYAKYEYVDEKGLKLYRVCRRPDSESGTRRKWLQACIVHRNGVPEWRSGTGCMKGVRRVLYNLPNVLSAVERGEDVWVVEGEPAADALIREGVCATTNSNGIRSWEGSFTDALVGASLVLSPDKDADGFRGMLRRYALLKPVAKSIRIALAKGKDSDDHFSTGFGLWDFEEINADDLQEFAEIAESTLDEGELPLSDPMPAAEWSDIGMAKRFAEVNREALCYVPELGQWRTFSGCVWVNCGEETEPLKRAHILAERMANVVRGMSESEKEKLTRESPRSLESTRTVSAMLKNAIPYLLVSESAFDTNRKALVLPDCVLVAEPRVSTNGASASTSTALAASPLSEHVHSAQFFSTQQITVLRNNSAQCPHFRQLLTGSIPDKAQRAYLQTMIGFGLIGGDRVKKRVVNLIGPKDSGKSTLLRVLEDVLGDYCVTPAVDDLLSSGRRSDSQFALHSLRHARIAIVNEPERRSRFNAAVLKRLTGGDKVRTEAKYRNSISWRASVLVLLASNDPVVFDSTDKAFGDRLVPIRFEHPAVLDRTLNEALEAEHEGVLRWILRGVERAARGELTEPLSVIRSRERYVTDIETPFEFLERAAELGRITLTKSASPRHYATPHALYRMYESWCSSEGIKPYAFRRFCDVLYTKHPQERFRNERHFCGIVIA